VLSEEVASAGVQAACQEGRDQEVDEGSKAKKVIDNRIERELDGEVDKVPEAGLLGAHKIK